MATPRLTLNFNTDDPLRTMARFAARAPRAVSRALNRTAVSVRTVMAKEIAQDTGIASTKVRARCRITNATPTRQTATVSASPAPIPLIDYHARGRYPSRGRGAGVTAMLPSPTGRGRVMVRFPKAFIAIVNRGKSSGHRGVFERQTTKRLPIVQGFGPSIADVFAKHISIGQQRGEEALAKNLQHEMNFLLGQTGS